MRLAYKASVPHYRLPIYPYGAGFDGVRTDYERWICCRIIEPCDASSARDAGLHWQQRASANARHHHAASIGVLNKRPGPGVVCKKARTLCTSRHQDAGVFLRSRIIQSSIYIEETGAPKKAVHLDGPVAERYFFHSVAGPVQRDLRKEKFLLLNPSATRAAILMLCVIGRTFTFRTRPSDAGTDARGAAKRRASGEWPFGTRYTSAPYLTTDRTLNQRTDR
jgi:hypothetical protein